MQRILVALDRSPRAPHVLAEALELARRTSARLRLFRAITMPPELPTSVWAVPAPRLLDDLRATARADLSDLAATVPADVLDGIVVHVGIAWDAVCDAAREYDADLIVIGSHGYGLLDRLVGTTAAKIVNHADRSVLVVRARDDEAQAHEPVGIAGAALA